MAENATPSNEQLLAEVAVLRSRVRQLEASATSRAPETPATLPIDSPTVEALQTFLGLSLDGFLVLKPVLTGGQIVDFEITFANPAAEAMMKHSPITGKRLLEILPGHAGRGGLFEQFVRVFETGEPHDIEFHYESEGICGWFRNMSVKLDDGIAITFSDISLRKQAEEALRESQAKMEAALSSMTDAVFISDAEGHFLEFNDAFATFHRFRDRAECGKTFREYPDILEVYTPDGEFVPPDLWVLRRALRGETAADVEYSLRRKDTGETWVGSYSFAPIRNSSGAISGAVVAARDITQRKRERDEVGNLSKQLQLALDGAKLGWWQYDLRTQISTWDNRYKEIFGVEAGSLPNEEILKRLHPEDAPNVWKQVEAALNLEASQPYRAEYRINLPDGSMKWIEAHGIASFEGSGESRRAARLVGTVADVTERKRIEEERLHVHQLMHYVISHARSAIAVHDRDMRYLYVSDRYLNDYNVKERDVLGKHHYDVFPDLPQKWRDVHRRVLKGEVLGNEEDEYVREDGSVVWTRWECRPWYESDGAIGGLIVYTEVITEQVEARQRLRQSLEELKKAQAFANIGSWTWHVKENRFEPSEHMCRIFGLEPGATERQIGQAALAAIHPDDRASLEDTQRKIRRFKIPAPIEFRMNLPDKGVRVLRIEIGEIVRNEHGEPVQTKGVVQDITEMKRAEEERQSLQLQLMQSQKMESVGRLAGGVAHDFNNMLGVIMGCAELALRELEPDSAIRQDLIEIRQAAQRSADLTRQLLAFARRQTLAPKVIDLNDSIGAMIKMLRRLIGESIDLTWRPGLDLWPVLLDPGQVDQILVNLLVNARDAIATAGKITLETENIFVDEEYCGSHSGITPGEYALLAVSDTGCGMDEDTRLHIFEPFFTTKKVGEGTGLGLATVYGSVIQGNGHINVYSEPGLGTTFRIYFPRHRFEAKPEAGATEQEPPHGHGESILLVEDEAALLKITKTMLLMLGYQVLCATSSEEALRIAEEHPTEVHLLMTDVVMPDMNGRQLAERMLAQHPRAKLLYMSGYTADVIAHHGILEEGVNFIQKPIALDDLAFKVRTVLDAP